jgi:hypothetical protein
LSDAYRRVLLLAVAAVVVVVLVVAGVVLSNRPQKPTAAPTPTPSVTTTVALKPALSSFAPSGSGFQLDGKTWHTQWYNTETFGNLKSGVGLVLDLGSARELSSVTFDAGKGPLTVGLRAADGLPAGNDQASLSPYAKVGKTATGASGQTTISATDGGKHRYWMLWVTKLGVYDAEGYSARITGVSVKALK